MKKILILGAGLMTKTMVDYFIDKCQYHVTVASRTVSKAEKIVEGREFAKAVSWTTEDVDKLEEMVQEVDFVICMIPQTAIDMVASVCLKHNTSVLQTDYISPYLYSIDEEARKKDIIILNEIGEDPGLDNMGVMETIDEIRAEGGKILSVQSYGAGLPAFEYNRNPFGYKFSWSPKGLMISARATAAYLKEGKKIEVPLIFEHHKLIDIEGLGTFETYPNRDCLRYTKHYGLDRNTVSLYRGLLRFPGYCNTMRTIKKFHFFDDEKHYNFKGMTYAELFADLINTNSTKNIKKKAAEYVNMNEKDDIIEKLEWLGLFDDKIVSVESGMYSDVLVDLMLKKLSYAPGERDMIIVHDEIIAEFPDRKEKRTSTMIHEGIPYGETAMTRAVSLPASIGTKLFLEGKIKARGVHMPSTPEFYKPILEEMKSYGFEFKKKTIKL